MQQNKQNYLALLIGLCAHTIRDNDPGNKKRGVTVSKDGAGYQPLAWWFTKKRLGRELRNLYEAAEELPPQLLALIGKLEGKLERSLQAKSECRGINEVVIPGRPSVATLTRDGARRIEIAKSLFGSPPRRGAVITARVH